jgi:hypothetical protein
MLITFLYDMISFVLTNFFLLFGTHQLQGPSLFPEELKKLEDQVYAFKIEISEFNQKNDYRVYTILKMTQDPQILSEIRTMKMNLSMVSIFCDFLLFIDMAFLCYYFIYIYVET